MLALAWTILVGGLLLRSRILERGFVLRLATAEASAAVDKDFQYRLWASRHGGVYVPVTAETQPNPYLRVPERDVVTTTGRHLTLVNPAYMTRQVHEGAAEAYGTKARITSLRPLRPSNEPTPWERTALETLERDPKRTNVVALEEGVKVLRYLRPMHAQSSCLRCHSTQGYALGSLVGGLSVSVPTSGYEAIAASRWRNALVTYGVIWVVGLGTVLLAALISRRRHRERDEFERTLAESEAHFRALYEEAPIAYQSLDLEGHILQVNGAWLRLLGYERDEVVGKHISAFIDPSTAAVALPRFKNFIETGILSNAEYHFRHKDGREIVVVAEGRILRDRALGQPRTHCVLQDVTDKKQLEERLLRSQRLESLGVLAGGVAHDLNNVLSPILMAAGALRDEVTSQSALELVQTIESCAHRSGEVVRQILTFARGIGGQRGPLDVAQHVREIERMLRETFPKSIHLELRVPPSLPAILGDGTQLQQLLMNLCLNARDAMPSGGTLELSAEAIRIDRDLSTALPPLRAGDYVALTVRDSGVGIPKAIQDRMFDPFFTTKPPGMGTGLGLSSALGIAQRHGGGFVVDSAEGKGTRFVVYLPIAEAQAATKERAEAPAELEGKGRLVLLADDEPAIRRLVQRGLERRGFEVLTAQNGRDALTLLEGEPRRVQLVITDLSMPVLDGAGLIAALRARGDERPILLMSGLGETLGEEGAKALGAQGILVKPFSVPELLGEIERLLPPA